MVKSHVNGAGTADRTVPVAPGRWPLLGHAFSLRRRPLRFMSSLRAYGDVVMIYMGTLPVHVLTDSELAYRALAVEADKFEKGIFIEKFRPYFGNGLALSSGDFYRRQRRLVQPAFHRNRITRYAEVMIDLTAAMTKSWRPGQIVPVDEQLQDLALDIVGRTLFATELGRRAAEEVRRYVPILLHDGLVRAFSPKLVEKLPIPGNRRFDDAIARLRRVVGEVVTQARADGRDRGDLLSTLLLARDEDTGEGMSDRQVQDEVVTLLTAGRAGMNAAGYATLTVDRVGTGRSSRPLLSATMTATSQADVMHQTVHKLRAGALGPRYDNVIIGGHSLGATISIIEAANYRDVDGVLVASIVHRLDAIDLALDGLLSFVPAALDPVLASRGYDPGYLTTRVGTRERAFHNPAIPTPQAIAHDESTKDAFAVTEAADGIGVGILTPYSALVDVPVLIAMGGHDKLFCSPVGADCSSAAALRAQEAPFYSSTAQLEVYLLAGNYGHSFNYAPNADEFHRTVAHWADRMVGR